MGLSNKRKLVTAKQWRDVGNVLGANGKYQAAIECFDQAIRLDSKDFESWRNKGLALGRLGESKMDQFHRARLKCYNRALSINPKDFLGWYNKGFVLSVWSDNQRGAIKCLDRALKIKPNDLNALGCKGLSLRESGKYQEALKCFDRALKIKPDNKGLKRQRVELEKLMKSKKPRKL